MKIKWDNFCKAFKKLFGHIKFCVSVHCCRHHHLALPRRRGLLVWWSGSRTAWVDETVVCYDGPLRGRAPPMTPGFDLSAKMIEGPRPASSFQVPGVLKEISSFPASSCLLIAPSPGRPCILDLWSLVLEGYDSEIWFGSKVSKAPGTGLLLQPSFPEFQGEWCRTMFSIAPNVYICHWNLHNRFG